MAGSSASSDGLLATKSADEYLRLIGGWVDPNPPIVLREHESVIVVRDDVLAVGSKVRFLDYLIGHDKNSKDVDEWVYGSSPAYGYAQMSLAHVCARYNKKAILFSAQRDLSRLHAYQKRAIELGAEFHWIEHGMLNVTQARARAYCAKNRRSRRLLSMGLCDDTVIASIIRVARSLRSRGHFDDSPDYVWCAAGSGTLSRGLQLAFPSAEVHVVEVGHKLTPHELANAIRHRSHLSFQQVPKSRDLPPFPSAENYDAKVWPILKKWMKEDYNGGTILLWNVGG